LRNSRLLGYGLSLKITRIQFVLTLGSLQDSAFPYTFQCMDKKMINSQVDSHHL